jgi:hypothetical protein
VAISGFIHSVGQNKDFPFSAQSPGSLTTTFTGTQLANLDLAANTVSFTAAGSSIAGNDTGTYRPATGGTDGFASANYGGQDPSLYHLYFAIRNDRVAFSTTTPLALSGTGSVRTVPSTETIQLLNCVLDYFPVDSPSDFGSINLAGSSASNAAAASGQFVDQNNGTASLTSPINATYQQIPVDGNAFLLTFTLTGSVSGTVPFPTADLNGPGAGTDATASFAAGGPAVAIAPAAVVLRSPAVNLTSATVVLTNRPNGTAEALAVNLAGTGLTSTGYNPSTGTLTITGAAPLAMYQAALRSLTYANTAGSNTTTGNRVITVTVNDGTINSLPHTATVAVVAPPVLASIENSVLAYTERSPAAPITATLTASDSDSPTLASATVGISSNYQNGQDVLSYVAPAGNPVAGAFNVATGVLTLNGAGTPAQYQAALRAVMYQNPSENPATAPRTVSFVVNDGASNSNVASRTITVTAVNDPPALFQVEPFALVYAANDPSTPVTSTVIVVDVDSPTLASGVVGISANYQSGQDVLSYVAPPGNPVTGTFSPANGMLNLSGPGTQAQFQAALRAVNYQNTSNHPATTPRTLSMQVSDGSDLSNVATRQITFVDNPPVVTDIQVNDGSAQRSRITRLTVTFNKVISLDSGALTLAGFAGQLTSAVDNSGGQSTVTLTFDGLGTEFGSLADGNYTLTVTGAYVHDAAGNQLSGNASLNFHRLFGDINGDKAVNGLDLTAFRNAFGTVSTDANYLSFLDFNGDGAINGADLIQFRNRFGVILP